MALDYPEDLQYFDSHEYARLDDNEATIGITAYAIEQLGDVVFLELPEVGDEVIKGDRLGSVESVKAVEDIYAPLSGTVIERNETLLETPESLGDDPYGDGWLIKIKISEEEDWDEGMTAEDYQALVEGL
ncbi:MAG: glycine cleavage system protein GcvH [Prochlorotrichaceae cyanobacterium]|jgi:glycine cleavage system H protein